MLACDTHNCHLRGWIVKEGNSKALLSTQAVWEEHDWHFQVLFCFKSFTSNNSCCPSLQSLVHTSPDILPRLCYVNVQVSCFNLSSTKNAHLSLNVKLYVEQMQYIAPMYCSNSCAVFNQGDASTEAAKAHVHHNCLLLHNILYCPYWQWAC